MSAAATKATATGAELAPSRQLTRFLSRAHISRTAVQFGLSKGDGSGPKNQETQIWKPAGDKFKFL